MSKNVCRLHDAGNPQESFMQVQSGFAQHFAITPTNSRVGWEGNVLNADTGMIGQPRD
jgi:hypothetical protein